MEEWENAPISVCLRKGDVAFNNLESEQTFARRDKMEWPIAMTEYTTFFLSPDLAMDKYVIKTAGSTILSYDAGDFPGKGVKVQEFKMPLVEAEL